MPRRYYLSDDSEEFIRFAGWATTMTVAGLAALINNLRPRANAYTPALPDDPRQVAWYEGAPKLDWTQAKPPKLSIPKLGKLEDLKNVRVNWAKEDRPQIVPRDEGKAPFTYPNVIGDARIYRIFPNKLPLDTASSRALLETVLMACPRLTFEIVADGHATFFQISDLEGRYPENVILEAIRSKYQSSQVEIVEQAVEARQYPFFRQLVTFGLVNEYAAPIPYYGDLTTYDPLVSIVQRMDFLNPELEERLTYQLFVLTPTIEAQNRAGKRLMDGRVRPSSGFFEKDDPLSGFDPKLIETKLAGPLYHCFLAVTAESQKQERLAELVQLAQDVQLIKTQRHNGLQIVGHPNMVHTVNDENEASIPWFQSLLTLLVRGEKSEWRRFLLVLTPQEMASLWHLPHEGFLAQKMVWASHTLPTELTGSAASEQGDERVCIGDTTVSGKRTPVYLIPQDRESHVFIAGKTKTGKSTLIHNLVHQDIAAGRGVAVLDPHGQLVDAILARSIPPERQKDVLVLECGRADLPVPLNPFRIPTGVSFSSASDTLYWVIRKIYQDIWLEGRTDMVMRNVIEALLTDPEATPMDIDRLFFDDAYRAASIKRMEAYDEVSLETIRYWREFGKRSAGEKREIADPIRNRRGALLGKRLLEYMTCHPNALHFGQLIAGRKIILINLSGNDIRSTAANLGAIFLSSFFLAAESLGYLSAGAAPRMHVYVDEVERFVTTPLPDMFSQARKFGLSLSLASQFLKQLSEDVLEGIFGNVGTELLFEVGPLDLSVLKPLVQPEIDADDLLKLGLHRMVVKTRADGKNVPAFVVDTRSQPEAVGPAYALPDYVTGYGFLPKADVQAWLTKRYAAPQTPEAEAEVPVEKPSKKPAKRTVHRKAKTNPPPPKPKKKGKVTDFE
jgi:hypothetical protein